MRYLLNVAKTPFLPAIGSIRYASTKAGPEILKARFADPVYDIPFRKLFAGENSKPILKSVLTSLLGFKGISIKDIEFLDPVMLPEYDGNLIAEVDVKCRLSDSKEILVEMQRVNKEYFLPRTQYYMARSISLQMQESEGMLHHKMMLPTYMLVLAGNSVFTPKNTDNDAFALGQDKHFEKTIIPYIEEMGIPFPLKHNKMFWKFFELNKFAKLKSEGAIDLQNPKNQWLDFLITCARQDDIPTGIIPEIREAYKIMEMHQWSPVEFQRYEAEIKRGAETDRVDAYSLYQEEIEEGRAKGKIEGREEGRVEGMEKGIKKGMEKGMEKGQAVSKIQIVKELLAIGTMGDAEIIKVTNITPLQLQKIKDSSAEIQNEQLADILFCTNICTHSFELETLGENQLPTQVHPNDLE
jgi:predicted transposase/invertase (TIGR01784 family)